MRMIQEASLDNHIERIYPLLTKGYSFLFRKGSKAGHWNEVRSTALAGMCVEIVETGDSHWLKCIKKWLVDNQIHDGEAVGSWGEEIWDTAMCLVALKSLGFSSKDETIQRGLKWIESLYSVNGRGNWHDEPWETSWALLAILISGVDIKQANVSEAIHWLMSFQGTTGRIISPHYSAYFILINEKLDKAGIDPAVHEDIMQANMKAANYLIVMLEQCDKNKLWTGESWSNGQILWALAKSRLFPISKEDLLRKTVDWFEASQESEGNWSDIEDTASAMLGLYSLLEMIVSHSEGTQSAKEKIFRILRKKVSTPPLYIKRPFIEKNNDTGGLSINLNKITIKNIAIVGLLATIAATVVQLLDFVWGYWIK